MPTLIIVQSYKRWSIKLRRAAKYSRPVNKFRLLKYLNVANVNIALRTLAKEDLIILIAAVR